MSSIRENSTKVGEAYRILYIRFRKGRRNSSVFLVYINAEEATEYRITEKPTKTDASLCLLFIIHERDNQKSVSQSVMGDGCWGWNATIGAYMISFINIFVTHLSPPPTDWVRLGSLVTEAGNGI